MSQDIAHFALTQSKALDELECFGQQHVGPTHAFHRGRGVERQLAQMAFRHRLTLDEQRTATALEVTHFEGEGIQNTGLEFGKRAVFLIILGGLVLDDGISQGTEAKDGCSILLAKNRKKAVRTRSGHLDPPCEPCAVRSRGGLCEVGRGDRCRRAERITGQVGRRKEFGGDPLLRN